MSNSENKLWPYKPKLSFIISFGIAVLLIAIVAILRATIEWPQDASTNIVLIGILFLSMLPILLSILDIIIGKGGSVGYKDFKIDFGKVERAGLRGFTIPANIGVPGNPVADSGTSNILQILKEATSNGIVIVDLEDGHAWWESRLLVLVAGAQRLGKPDKIVFIGNEEGKHGVFQGWAEPEDLTLQLLQGNEQYRRHFHDANSAANQWALFGSLKKIPPNNLYQFPPNPVWMTNSIAINYSWMAFSIETGLPNELLFEQYLQNELGEKIEKQPDGPRHISIVRLNELFKPVLFKQAIDTSWTNEQQTSALFSNDAKCLAITDNGKYVSLVSRQVLLNAALKNVFSNQEK